MTSPPPEPGAVAPPTTNARDRSNGRAGLDPAHGGPLPQATLPELVGRLINDVSDLADRQIELAKQEIGEAKDEAISAVFRIAIGAGIAAVAGLLLVIWAWSAFIWFFNWLGSWMALPMADDRLPLAWALGAILGAVAGGMVGHGLWARRGAAIGIVIGAIVAALLALAGLGWLMGVLVPAFAAWIAYSRFIRGGINQAISIWPPLPRTQETLKEDLEWVKRLRTPSET